MSGIHNPTPHNLLSTLHPDTLAASVVAGDLLIGNATPKWARLGLGSATNVLGISGGLPAWQAQSYIDHGSLGGLGDDDHSQYTLKGGRTGTTNDTTLSTDATGSLRGSSVSSSHLDLLAGATSMSFGNTGRIRLRERLTWPDNLTVNASSLNTGLISYGGTIDCAGQGTVAFAGFNYRPTYKFDTAQFISTAPGMWLQPTFQHVAALTDTASNYAALYAESDFDIAHSGGAGTIPLISAYTGQITTSRTTGTGTVTITDAACFTSGNLFGKSIVAGTGTTITNASVFRATDVGTGTFTNIYGFNCAALSVGGTLSAAFHSDVAANTKRYFLHGIGDAQSVIKGKVRIGDTATNPTLQLEVAAGAITGNMDTMTYAATISLDVTLGNLHKTTTVNATGNATINASAAGTAGQHIWVLVINDATSGKTITFGTNFKPSATVVGTISKAALVHFVSDGVNWYEVARTLGL